MWCFENLSKNLEDQFPGCYKDKIGWCVPLKDFKAALLIVVLICTTSVYKRKCVLPGQHGLEVEC